MDKKNSSEVIDIQGLLKQYLSKWYLFAISIVVCCGLAAFWYTRKLPVYTVTANVLIETSDNDPFSSLSMGSLFGSSNYVDDEIFVFTSHSLYRNVAKELGLDRRRIFSDGFMKKNVMVKDYPLDVLVPAEFADTASVGLSFKIKLSDKGKADILVKGPRKVVLADVDDVTLPYHVKTIYGDFAVVTTPSYDPQESYKATIQVMGYDAAAELLAEDITAEISNKRTHVITLTYPTDNPKFGKKVLNCVMTKYDERVLNSKNLQGNKTIEFLDKRLADLYSEIGNLEGGIQKYKEANNLVDITADTEYNYTLKGELTKQLYAAEGNLELSRLAAEFIATPGNEYALIPYVSNDSGEGGANGLTNAFNTLALKRMELLNDATPDNYQVKKIEDQLDVMRKNLAETLRKQVINYQTTLREIQGKVNSAQGSLDNLPRQEKEMIDLNRTFYQKQNLYYLLTSKREEAAIMVSNAVSTGTVVDAAFVPTKPSSMSLKKLLIVAFCAGLVLPMIFLFTRKLLRGKPETRAEIESDCDAPILGEIPTSRSGKTLVVKKNSVSSAVELFKLIRTNLQFFFRNDEHKTVIVTSTRPGEGKSFVAINTAAAYALQGKRVLLVGMDIRKPKLAEYLDLPESRPGITSYLSRRDVSFRDLIQPVGQVENLSVVTAGVIPPNPAEMLLDPRLKDFFDLAREEFDYIFIDSAPVGMVSDTMSLAQFADATIYVTRLGVTTNKDIDLINTLYEENRLPHISVVVNGVTSSASSGYGYGYGHEDKGKHEEEKKGLLGRLFSK